MIEVFRTSLKQTDRQSNTNLEDELAEEASIEHTTAKVMTNFYKNSYYILRRTQKPKITITITIFFIWRNTVFKHH